MPAHRVFIDVNRSTTPPPLVLRPRSPRTPPRSPRNISYRRHSLGYDDRPAFTIRDDLDIMQDRDHGLRAANDSLLRHNHVLKTQIQTKERTIREQQALIEQLELENLELQRNLESNSDVEGRRENKIRELRKKNTRLESENENLTKRIRELVRQVREATDDRVRLLKEELMDWRRRCEDVERRLKRLRENLNEHIDTNRQLTIENERLARELEIQERMRRRR
ncbi:hypothetical protein QBC47DRAFT_21765 [Echria macrotheca]|uniref:Uncharacterized protein n=1 Tax=Echria macrotheca TaxID=438768 RepID=A0AAJ0BMN8_9PEZI|nr:hypothetical protein QBC47DRAFT_21765 [Echria macrotheca]